MQRRFQIHIILLVALSYVSFILPHKALAEELVVAPAYQAIDLKNGETATANITLTNNSDHEVTFNLFTLNFSQNDKGIIEFLGKDSSTYSYALASYIKLPQDSLRVSPHSEETISFTIQDRQDLSPGGHYAAVVAQADQSPSTQKGSAQFTPALASLLLLRKMGGEIFNLSLKEVNWPYRIVQFRYPSHIALTFQNEGNIHVIPRGRIDVYDMFGRQVYKGVLNSASQYVFPSSRRTIDVPLSRVAFTFPISVDHIIIKGDDSLHKVSYSYRETYVHIEPLGIGLILLLCTLGIIVRKRRKVS